MSVKSSYTEDEPDFNEQSFPLRVGHSYTSVKCLMGCFVMNFERDLYVIAAVMAVC